MRRFAIFAEFCLLAAASVFSILMGVIAVLSWIGSHQLAGQFGRALAEWQHEGKWQ